MKQGLHPNYEKTTIKCACGNEFTTNSTVHPDIHVELCSACHPFYTGKQKFVDTAGRVDKFRARLEKAQSNKGTSQAGAQSESKDEKSNAEKLAEIKKEITTDDKGNSSTDAQSASVEADATEKDIAVSQEANSDVEIAAAEELEETKDNQ